MRFLKRLDFRGISNAVHHGGGTTLGYGLLVGTRTFIGVVRTVPRVKPVKGRHMGLTRRQEKMAQAEMSRRAAAEAKAIHADDAVGHLTAAEVEQAFQEIAQKKAAEAAKPLTEQLRDAGALVEVKEKEVPDGNTNPAGQAPGV